MKKMILLVVCLTMMGILRVNAQAAIAALHHEGKVTIYSSAQVAIDNSVNGDTIYLSEGMFGEFTINKDVAVIGSGMKTTVSPSINIGSADLSNVTLSNLVIVSNLNFINGNISNVKIRQCKINGNLFFNWSGEIITDIEISMCYIVGRIRPSCYSTNNVSVINSKIGEISGGGISNGSVNFVNCNIKMPPTWSTYSDHGQDPERNNYSNCIFSTIASGNYKNCMFTNDGGGGSKSDVYSGVDFYFDDNLNCSLSDEDLKAGGYLGTDGTVVGITGGATPYTLASPYLRITDHQLEVDNEQRKLRVTLTLGTEE